MPTNQNMLPGYKAGKSFGYRALRKGGSFKLLPGGIVINGALSRDPLHTGYLDVLRAGMMLGLVTASKLFAPSLTGVTTVAYDAAATVNTQLTVSPATAVEIVRRYGTSGTFHITGPPTAGGVVAVNTTVTYSAVNVTTGVVTITALGANFIAGSWIQPEDGSEVAVGLLDREDGLKMTDDLSANMNVAAQLLIAGTIDSSQIINWPSNAPLRLHLKGLLNAVSAGQFVFDDAYVG